MKRRLISNAAHRCAGATRRGFKPTLELLEGRLVPATCVWTGAFGNGSWFNLFNWSTLSVPGSGDTAAFTQPAPNCILSGANATIGCLIMHGWGGTLTIGDGSTLTVTQSPTTGPSDIADGTITGTGSAALIFSTSTAVSLGGTITTPNTRFGGMTTVANNRVPKLGGNVGNYGVFTITAGTVLMLPNSTLKNNHTFVLNFQGTNIAPTSGGVNGQLFINALGSLTKVNAGNATFAVPFLNFALFDIKSGTVTFTSTAVQKTGTTDIETGAILASTTSIQLDAGNLFTGTSQIRGDLNVVAATVHPGVLDTVPYGTLSVAGGFLQGPNSKLGMSIFLNSDGSVKQYTSVHAVSMGCGGALIVGTGPYSVAPKMTDLANIISSSALGGEFVVSGAVSATSPILVWVHNQLAPASIYQLKVTLGGSTAGTGGTLQPSALVAAASNATTSVQTASSTITAAAVSNPVPANQSPLPLAAIPSQLNTQAVNALMAMVRFRRFQESSGLIASTSIGLPHSPSEEFSVFG